MASPILGPITEVPYDVLTEIFVHCLPQRRLQHCQPNTTIAPILLCHVCSAWRTVAMETTMLWTHLSCRLKVHSRSLHLNWIVRKKEYAFLLWWKNNQRSMPLYLCLDMQVETNNPILDSELKLDEVEMFSLLEYISSAKYIETNGLYWSIMGFCVHSGYPIIYPDPHTLIISHRIQSLDYFYHQLALILNPSPSVLRRLYLKGQTRIYDLKITTYWTSLTHCALFIPEMSLNYWYTLIRAVQQLQLGHFEIELLDDDTYTAPTPYTLAQLSTLSISVEMICHNSDLEFPLALLVTALHLPALRDLSLCSEEEWYDHRGLDHVYTVLDATPAITTLTLGSSFLTYHNDEENRVQMLARLKDAEPVWRRAPHLAHLRLVAEAPGQIQKYSEEQRDAFVRNLVHRDNPWLDLHNSACPIQRITIIDRDPIYNIADYTWSRIREYAGGLPDVKIAFDVIFETADEAIAGAWNEWGPNLP